MIPGGYILKARAIQQAGIAHCAPVVREVWDWLLRNANYKKTDYDGHTVLRGQVFCNYETIAKELSWMVGYRKMRYTPDQIKKAMKTLRSPPTGSPMVAQVKAPRGTLVTVLNYDYYQDKKNYESTSEGTNESTNGSPAKAPTISKEVRKKEVSKTSSNGRFTPPTIEEIEARCEEMRYTLDPNRFFHFYESKAWMVGRNKMKSWQSALAGWESRNKSEKPTHSTKGMKVTRSSGAAKTFAKVKEMQDARRRREGASGDNTGLLPKLD